MVGTFWQPPLDLVGTTIAYHTVNFTFFKSFADGCTHVTGIKASRLGLKTKALPLVIESVKIRNAIMNIGRRDMRISDQVVFAAGGTMVEIEEPLGFAFTHHIAAIRVGGTLFDLFALGCCRLWG